MSHRGTVYLVGAGPGDPELVTRKAERLIRQSDAVVYDYLVAPEILDWAGPACRKICVGKRAGFHSLPQDQIQALLCELAEEGLSVVRLKGGDPFVFGRGGEEALALAAAGIRFEVVPAVTASLGCAAYAGIPLSHRGRSGAITFISGHESPAHAASVPIDWNLHAQSRATLVLYMAMGRLAEIAQRLIEGGRPADTPSAVVEWGTTPRQRQVTAPLAEIAAVAAERGIGAPGIVIIGPVVALAAELAWFAGTAPDKKENPQR